MRYSEKDRELLENIDRLLKGREPEITDAKDEDTGSALDFARKFIDMGEKPSDTFTQDLKAQIVRQLDEREKREQTEDVELLFWGVPRRKLWQGTIAALIPVIIMGIIMLIVFLLDK